MAESFLPADTVALIVGYLSPIDLLSVAGTCKTLNVICNDVLSRMQKVNLAGTACSARCLSWLLKERLSGMVEALDVTGCRQISKAELLRSMRGCPSLSELTARDIGLGSWAPPALHKLLAASPPALRCGKIEVDACILLNQNMSGDVATLLSHPALCIRKMVAIRTLGRVVTSAAAADGAANGATTADVTAAASATAATTTISATSAAAAVAAAALAAGAAAAMAALNDANGMQQQLWTPPAPPAAPGDPLVQLAHVLSERRTLHHLDGSSGSLGQFGGVQKLVAPLLRAKGCALRWLACSDVSRDGIAALTSALAVNSSLRYLKLGCNTISKASAGLLAASLACHASLTALTLEHNPICEDGAVAIAATLKHNAIESLSIAFTGAGDDACDEIAAAIASRCALTDISLCGNGVGSRGVVALADALEAAGPTGRLRALNLSANCSPDASRRITPDAIKRLAVALPSSVLRRLELAGCGITAHALGLLAAALPQTSLSFIDLSSNHFGCEGAWGLAWGLADSTCVRTLVLSDCAIADDGGDELADALASPLVASIVKIDLRGNKISEGHRLHDDLRVDLGFQRPSADAAKVVSS